MKAKSRKIIKRVYERGRETVVPPAKKQNNVARQKAPRQQPVAAAKTKIVLPATKTIIIDNYQLPPRYNTTRITLLVKDPFWVYAYWEIASNSIESLSNIVGSHEIERAKVILRMYDVSLIDFNGTNANHYFDIEVGYNASNWYVSLWNDGVSYIAEIGMRLQDGRFFAFARSNSVTTPRKSYSPRSEQVWMNVTEESSPSAYVVPQIKIFKREERTYYTAAQRKRFFYLTEEDIRRYYSKLSPLLKDIISSRLSRLYGKRARYGFILEGETPEARRKLLGKLPKGHFLKRVLIGSSEELFLIGASESLHERPEHRKFFFELNAEVIVYGRTEPDAEVYLGGKKIQLQPDGTFSLRMALPDGKIPLEFKAISKDKKETRAINTYIQRNTNYTPR